MRNLILIMLLFVSIASKAQDPRDSLIGCYYCDITKYGNSIYQGSYPKDTVRIEKNDTLFNRINVYSVWPGSLDYYYFSLGYVLSDSTFYADGNGEIVHSDSLYYSIYGSSFTEVRFKCEQIDIPLSVNISTIPTIPEFNLSFNIGDKTLFLYSPQTSDAICKVFSVNGMEVMKQKLTLQQGSNTIPLNELKEGLYIIALYTKEKQYVKKIVVY